MSTTSKKPDAAPGQPEISELDGLDVREVSVVDRPANKRRFLIVKRAEDVMPKIEVSHDADFLTEILKLAGADDAESTAKAAAGELSRAVAEVVGKLSKTVATIKTEFDKAGADKSKVPESVAADLRDVQQALSTIADALGKKGEAPQAKAAGDALQVCTQALEQLMALTEKLKGLGEADAVPGDVADAIKAVAELLGGLEMSADGGKAPAKDGPKDGPPKGPPQAGSKGPAGEADKDANGEATIKAFVSKGDSDPEIILKIGSKMSKTRLSKLKSAVDTMISLVKELEGEADKDAKAIGKLAHATATLITPPVVDTVAIAKAASDSVAKLLGEKLDPLAKRLDALEGGNHGGNGEADPPAPVVKNAAGKGRVSFANVLKLPQTKQ